MEKIHERWGLLFYNNHLKPPSDSDRFLPVPKLLMDRCPKEMGYCFSLLLKLMEFCHCLLSDFFCSPKPRLNRGLRARFAEAFPESIKAHCFVVCFPNPDIHFGIHGFCRFNIFFYFRQLYLQNFQPAHIPSSFTVCLKRTSLYLLPYINTISSFCQGSCITSNARIVS